MIFQLQGVEFEWDEEKYAANLRKHGVKFEIAAEVFFDPFFQTGDASVGEEKREYIIGYSFSEKLFLVVFVERGIRTRIISPRTVSPTERKLYEES
ncbi:BrnT family toxin [soil metagenome]|nr:BrnT family toxin [Acidobacteriota bacterium]